ncbi:hypothetical protein BYT27DRAFT_7181575 [Phlegmacium glaucopus]|nr:hypothetical protein BYT27DRAFT_7181575 [Phlegmacium glaucopus]
MDVVDRNTLENATIVNQTPATDPRLEKTTNSPQLTSDVDENGLQIQKIQKIYHFHGTVYMDSLNSHSVAMENCANNNVRRVTYHRPKIMDCDEITHSQSHAAFTGPPTDSRTRGTYISFSMDCVVMLLWATLAVGCLAFFVMRLSSCGIGERMQASPQI